MRKRVKDFIEISDLTSLDRLITTLSAIRDSLPEGSEPELKMRGDDVFGRRLSICYFRELTAEEAALDDKYNGETGAGAQIAAIAKQLDGVRLGSAKRKAA
ncbi:MAG TPA: hypothetical protein VM913_00930 [Sphingomicrobium sp.]|jgi:hypothetical protein|nr:hypothetical protein [Sphingomicrobium sp.]